MLSLLLLASLALPQEPADFVGHWEGRIVGAGVDIDVDLAVDEAGAFSGDVTIPAQKVFDLALEAIALDGGELTFRISKIPGEPTFVGTLKDDGATLSGPFTQGGVELSFELRRAIDVPAPDAGLEAFGPWMREAMETWNVPGAAVAVVRGDTAVFAEGFGVREAGSEARVDADTLFAIGSSSKAFTTLTLATVIEKGELSWEDKIEDVLPGFRLEDERASSELTVRDVVTHRLGLPRHDLMWYARPEMTAAEIVRRMRHLPPNAELRETFQYNNLGFIVAGEVLREITGKTWAELVPERIFEPLGMKRSTVVGAAFLGDPNHATGHGEDAETKDIEVLPFRNIDNVGPAGSIGSSVNEMAQWLRFHLRDGTFGGETLVLPATLRELHTPQTIVRSLPDDPMLGITALAHGWFVDSYRGHLRIHHGGNIDGYSALVAFFPNDDLGIVCLTSKNATPLATFAIQHAADLAFGLEPRDWSGEAKIRMNAAESGDGEDDAPPPRIEGTTPSHDLAKFAGEYEHPGYGSLEIELDASGDAPRLGVRIGEITGELEHWHYDTFRVEKESDGRPSVAAGLLVRFETDDAGGVSAVHVKVEPALPPTRFQVASDPRLADPKVLEDFVGTYVYKTLELVVSLRGEHLVTDVAGQQTMTLVPRRDDTFGVEEAEGFAIKFRRDESGAVTAAELRQPNGTFIAQRKE